GFLNFTAPASFSGSLTINAAGGVVSLSGAGSLPNVSSITVNLGGSLIIDNTASASNDRVRNAAGITLSGGGLEFRGNKTSAVSEVVGTITTSTNFSSTITSVSQGQATTLNVNALTRNANSFVSFRGYGADLGSANNRMFFYTPLLPINDVLPFATLAKAGDV